MLVLRVLEDGDWEDGRMMQRSGENRQRVKLSEFDDANEKGKAKELSS